MAMPTMVSVAKRAVGNLKDVIDHAWGYSKSVMVGDDAPISVLDVLDLPNRPRKSERYPAFSRANTSD